MQTLVLLLIAICVWEVKGWGSYRHYGGRRHSWTGGYGSRNTGGSRYGGRRPPSGGHRPPPSHCDGPTKYICCQSWHGKVKICQVPDADNIETAWVGLEYSDTSCEFQGRVPRPADSDNLDSPQVFGLEGGHLWVLNCRIKAVLCYRDTEPECAGPTELIRCESKNNELQRCPVPDAEDIEDVWVDHRLTKTRCIYKGKVPPPDDPADMEDLGSFGLHEGDIWTLGCSARFRVCYSLSGDPDEFCGKCFYDNVEDPEWEGLLQYMDGNTVDNCMTYCHSYRYSVAAVQGGSYCSCQNYTSLHGEAPENECDAKCPGNQGQMCGGYLVSNVYNIEKCHKRKICDVYGDPHLETWDNHRYGFAGECSYFLMKSRRDDMEYYAVIGENIGCLNHPTASCLNSVTVKFKGKTFKLDQDLKVRLPNGNLVPLPYTDPHIKMFEVNEDPNHAVISVKLENGIRVIWNGRKRVVLSLRDDFGETRGLCGNNDGDADNEYMKPNGDLTDDKNVFGDSWAVPNSCPGP